MPVRNMTKDTQTIMVTLKKQDFERLVANAIENCRTPQLRAAYLLSRGLLTLTTSTGAVAARRVIDRAKTIKGDEPTDEDLLEALED